MTDEDFKRVALRILADQERPLLVRDLAESIARVAFNTPYNEEVRLKFRQCMENLEHDGLVESEKKMQWNPHADRDIPVPVCYKITPSGRASLQPRS